MWFKAFKDGVGKVSSKEGNSSPLIHVDDLADAYVRVAERGKHLRGHIFLITGSNEKISDITAALTKLTSFSGKVEYLPATDPLSEALCLNQRFSSQKAHSLLGWVPQHKSFVENIQSLYQTWLVYNS